ncbi:DUF2540 domain-containing protein [Methanococcus maripaludis]|uniref:Uncharacterized protein n=1 Tax=Methanococcus maripaludis TaxID=39152 RepID=A0A7J9PL86_METMI|nr:DUF2540 domain-containing protein [Methanococcus maripaludis]MBA2863975.1 hypothetical protein [Methanococcus maripaludis]
MITSKRPKAIPVQLIARVDSRTLKFILHNIKDMGPLPPEVIAVVMESKKTFNTQISPAEQDLKLFKKYGKKTTMLMINSYIYLNKDEVVRES